MNDNLPCVMSEHPMPMLPGLRRRELLCAALAGAAVVPLSALAQTGAETVGRLWFDTAGEMLAQAHSALALLADAASHGLEPQDYDAAALAQRFAQPIETAVAVDAADQALTRAFERFLADLHRGRVDPRLLRQNYDGAQPDGFDPTQVLRAAWLRQDLAGAVAAAVPQLPLYGKLRAALAHYRSLADASAWDERLAPLLRPAQSRTARLDPGQPWAGLERLAQRLQLLGDLDAGYRLASDPLLRYDDALADAVRRFQARHGLSADGVIGADTLAALEVTPAARVRQIELALERLRWTPLLQARRMIMVNLPEFRLRAYEVAEDGQLSIKLESKVIVGKALDTRTPLFDEDMRLIEFNPYWNVPPSIARSETLPKLRRDPGYFQRMGFEFVRPDGQVDRGLSDASLDALATGALRIRQRPSAQNALGDIKFVFPNADNIYLHHTPAVRLFGRERRDYSHGCIRVEKPVELAEFVLQGMPGWDRTRIEAMMRRGSSSTLTLAEPVPVLIAYETTWVKGDEIFFFNDFYGHDRALDQALRCPSNFAAQPATDRAACRSSA